MPFFSIQIAIASEAKGSCSFHIFNKLYYKTEKNDFKWKCCKLRNSFQAK